MRNILALAIGLAIGAAWAHSDSDNAAAPAGAYFDCNQLPDKALTHLPEPIAAWAKLDCLPVGQVIVERDGWSWRFPGSFFDKPRIFAAAPEESQFFPGMRYFTRITVEELDRPTAQERHQSFRAQFPTYSMENPPSRMLRLVAVNELTHPIEAFFSFDDDAHGWGIVCVPQCAVENVFMISRTTN